jgi:hypothetical protein
MPTFSSLLLLVILLLLAILIAGLTIWNSNIHKHTMNFQHYDADMPDMTAETRVSSYVQLENEEQNLPDK